MRGHKAPPLRQVETGPIGRSSSEDGDRAQPQIDRKQAEREQSAEQMDLAVLVAAAARA